MSMLKDPDMDEVVVEFCEESLGLCTKLESILDDIEDDKENVKLLEEFGQTIDRIMGAAKSLEANQVGLYAELGKSISYKASQSEDIKLRDLTVAVLFDTVEIMTMLLENIEESREEKAPGFDTNAFASRLRWLADKFKDIKRASVAIEGDSGYNEDIDALLKDLGL